MLVTANRFRPCHFATCRYTMEGNLSPYHGTFHPEAGVIPRTLYSLFDRLVESKCEYSVRCSYIELYNEELRDLNAADPSLLGSTSSSDAAPAPSPEPGSSAPKTLRIYEETKNGSTGVVIQGLEETVIQSAEDGLRVLRRGSERRQIAATNCNERSRCVSIVSFRQPTDFHTLISYKILVARIQSLRSMSRSATTRKKAPTSSRSANSTSSTSPGPRTSDGPARSIRERAKPA